jgi:hypothetical protein
LVGYLVDDSVVSMVACLVVDWVAKTESLSADWTVDYSVACLVD